MKERAINLYDHEVLAIFEGRKTQTRRVIKGQPNIVRWEPIVLDGYGGWVDDHGRPVRCPYGQPGDRLWGRETWRRNIQGMPDGITYLAGDAGVCPLSRFFDGTESYEAANEIKRFPRDGKWRSRLHMPRWASRINLENAGVRVERLNDISEKDALAEGVRRSQRAISSSEAVPCFWDYLRGEPNYRSAGDSFASLWESINGPGSWDANPLVWAIEFKRIEEAA